MVRLEILGLLDWFKRWRSAERLCSRVRETNGIHALVMPSFRPGYATGFPWDPKYTEHECPTVASQAA